MGSFFDELKALVNVLEPEQVLNEAHAIRPVDLSPEAVTRRLNLACELGEVCRSVRKVGRRLERALSQS